MRVLVLNFFGSFTVTSGLPVASGVNTPPGFLVSVLTLYTPPFVGEVTVKYVRLKPLPFWRVTISTVIVHGPVPEIDRMETTVWLRTGLIWIKPAVEGSFVCGAVQPAGMRRLTREPASKLPESGARKLNA